VKKMSNVRIRYDNHGETLLRSRRTFVIASGSEVVVELDLTNRKYRILDAVTQAEVTSGGNTRNIAVLKIQSKRALKQLGAQFSDEKRNRDGQAS